MWAPHNIAIFAKRLHHITSKKSYVILKGNNSTQVIIYLHINKNIVLQCIPSWCILFFTIPVESDSYAIRR
jgi:hypothetical protein